jgi:hypothetical protein
MAAGVSPTALQINVKFASGIALMGFVLVSGILTYLKGAFPGSLHPQLHLLAEKIAAGDVVLSDRTFPVPALALEGTTHAALVHGFGLVMLYGGVGVWVLAATSFITFRAPKATCSLPDKYDAQTEPGLPALQLIPMLLGMARYLLLLVILFVSGSSWSSKPRIRRPHWSL